MNIPEALTAANDAKADNLRGKYPMAAQVLANEVARLNNVLTSRIESDAATQNENLKMHKRLCKYEGHLPITDHEGRTWCELCECEIPQQIHPALIKNEFLEQLARLCEKYKATFDYDCHDDGIHIEIDEQEIFVGYLHIDSQRASAALLAARDTEVGVMKKEAIQHHTELAKQLAEKGDLAGSVAAMHQAQLIAAYVPRPEGGEVVTINIKTDFES